MREQADKANRNYSQGRFECKQERTRASAATAPGS
jgi:hypothetical protein